MVKAALHRITSVGVVKPLSFSLQRLIFTRQRLQVALSFSSKCKQSPIVLPVNTIVIL